MHFCLLSSCRMNLRKCLIISTSYDDLLESFDQLKRSFQTVRDDEHDYVIEIIKDLPEARLESRILLNEYDYFLIIISDNFSLELDTVKFFQVLEDIQRSGKQYWCVCDQRTIYARTLLRDLKLLNPYLDCLPYPMPDIVYLLSAYHLMTKEYIKDPEKRYGNWVHPYRSTEELTEYFYTQVVYLNE